WIWEYIKDPKTVKVIRPARRTATEGVRGNSQKDQRVGRKT
ncbi:unnamed protein product, partial [marine sediment metagenome]